MTVSPEIVVSVIFHLAGMTMMALSFVEISLIVRHLSENETGFVFFPGTRLPMYPLLILVGGSGFLYITFVFFQVSLMPPGVLLTEGPKLRYMGTAVTLIGGLLALYAMHKFSLQVKAKVTA